MDDSRTLDSSDIEILLALDQNPRASSVELARLSGLSRNTVISRLQRLERSEALAAPSIRVRPQACGYPLITFMTIELVQGAPKQVATYLQEVPEVLDVYAVTGNGDLLARIATRDTEHLYRVTQHILRAPGVVRSRSTIAIHELVPPRMAPLLQVSEDEAG